MNIQLLWQIATAIIAAGTITVAMNWVKSEWGNLFHTQLTGWGARIVQYIVCLGVAIGYGSGHSITIVGDIVLAVILVLLSGGLYTTALKPASTSTQTPLPPAAQPPAPKV